MNAIFKRGISGILSNIWYGHTQDYKDNVVSSIISGNQFNIENALQISTVYTCIRILTGVVSRLPINIMQEKNDERSVDKKDYRYNLLHNTPDGIRTSNKFIAVLETQRNLTGNSFARIYRNRLGKILKIEFIDSARVIDHGIINDQLYYKIRKLAPKEGDLEVVNNNDLLHFTSIVTKDGIWGQNPIEALRKNLSISHKALTTIDTFYDNNANSNRAIKSSINITGNVKQDSFLEAVKTLNEKYSGYTKAGKLIPLPPNTELQELSLSFKDAEFIGTIKSNKEDIGALYGVPPSAIGLFEASKFNNVEQMMLDFQINNLADILRMYRQELEFKLLSGTERLNGKTIEFNDKGLLATDYKTRIDSYKSLFGIGSITPNMINKLEGYPTYPAGDNHFIIGNAKSIEGNEIKEE